MRKVTEYEQTLVTGGTKNGKLDISGLTSAMSKSSMLSSEIHDALADGYTIRYDTTSDGDSDYDSTDLDINVESTYKGNITDTLNQLSHELGHFEHESNTRPSDYSNYGDYKRAQEADEGFAQLNAIKIMKQLGTPDNIPGDMNHIKIELHWFNAMENGRATDAEIAEKLGSIMSTQKLANGETYSQLWQSLWDKAHPSSGSGNSGGAEGNGGGDTMHGPFGPPPPQPTPPVYHGTVTVGPPMGNGGGQGN